MQFKVWKEEERKREVVYLRLVENDSLEIELIAVDENGEELIAGHILKIMERGIYRYSALSPDIGFRLDERTKIRLDE